MVPDRIRELVEKYAQKQATAQEISEIANWTKVRIEEEFGTPLQNWTHPLELLLPSPEELKKATQFESKPPVLGLIDPKAHTPDFAEACLHLLRDMEIEHGRGMLKMQELVVKRGSLFRHGESVEKITQKIDALTIEMASLAGAMVSLMAELRQKVL